MRAVIVRVAAFAVFAGSLSAACGSSHSASSASTGAGGAGPTRECVPGQSVACVAPGGCRGGQACRPDGSGFEACICATGSGGGTSSPSSSSTASTSSTTSSSASSGAGGHGMGGSAASSGGGDAGPDVVCDLACSVDHHAVVDCNGAVVEACSAGQGCDPTSLTCASACAAAADGRQSAGCEFYAVHPEADYPAQCFAAFITNTWSSAAHVGVEFYPGTSLTVASFGRIASGTGANITYTPYDAVAGVPPGATVILFLAGDGSAGTNDPCPVPTTAVAQGSVIQGTGARQAFHITTDVPVAAYQMSPYGGGAASITGASLLLPTSSWDTSYMGVTAAGYSSVTMDNPSLNIVASQDGTTVTMRPASAIVGGAGLPAGPANVPYTFTLTKGQQAQFSQQADLTGTVITSNNPIGVMAANACMQAPLGTNFCDHGEQMLPPVKAYGSEYAAVMWRPRVAGDMAIWHLVGLVDGTTLTYSSTVGGPPTLNQGQPVDFTTDQPFVVTSQDAAHPFMLFSYMTGSAWSGLSDKSGYGDPDFVLSVPPQQYLASYAFFTDPSFPETNLVVVRKKSSNLGFDDVTLDCAGALTGWQSVGSYEWTRVDLTRHDFQDQGPCTSGQHTMTSTTPFGLWVWGWGSPETTIRTTNVSYGYPAGMGVGPLNSVVIQ